MGFTHPFARWACSRNWLILLPASSCGCLILWQPRGHIRRLLTGTESKFHLHKKKE